MPAYTVSALGSTKITRKHPPLILYKTSYLQHGVVATTIMTSPHPMYAVFMKTERIRHSMHRSIQ